MMTTEIGGTSAPRAEAAPDEPLPRRGPETSKPPPSSGAEGRSPRPDPSRDAAGGRPVVLILAGAFPPDPRIGAARPGRFARYLPEFGFDPLVICGGFPPERAETTSIRRVPTPSPGRRARVLSRLAAGIQRHLLPYNDELDWAVHAGFEAEAVLAERPVRAVISTSPPLATHLAALWLKHRHGLSWLADFRDPLRGNPCRTRRWPFPYDRTLERLMVRHADALVANTDALAEMWGRDHPDAAGKVRVIWNGFDPEDRLAPLPLPERPRRVLAHVGSLYGGRHPGALLESLVRLIRRGELAADELMVRLTGPVAAGILDGSRSAREELSGLGCLELDDRMAPRDEARRITAGSDYLLLLDVSAAESNLQVPAKLFEYLQVGRPILAFTRAGSPVERLLAESGVPHRVCRQGADEAEVDRRVLELLALPTDPVPADARFAERFDGRNQARELARMIDALPPPPNRRRGSAGPAA